MQEYKNDKVTVRYDEKVCIHAGKCVQGDGKDEQRGDKM